MRSHVSGYLSLASVNIVASSGVPARTPSFAAYRGVDRSPWLSTDTDYRHGLLKGDALDAWRTIELQWQRETWIKLSTSRSGAEAILRDQTRRGRCGEVVALYSAVFDRSYGLQPMPDDARPFGREPCVEGYGSLLTEGVYRRPEFFEYFASQLTAEGLLPMTGDLCDEYVHRYLEVEKEADLEPVADVMSLLFVVDVFGMQSM